MGSATTHSTIIFWNANSVYGRLPIIEKYCHEKSPLLIAICESRLSPSADFPYTIHQYSPLSYAHTNQSGGHLFLIHSSVIFRECLSFNLQPTSASSTQVSAIELRLPQRPHRPVILVLVYICPSTFANDIRSVVDAIVKIDTAFQSTHDILYGGDFNCKNEFFASLSNNHTTTHMSSHLVSCIQSLDYSYLNDMYCRDQPTFPSKQSVLDLAFTSNPHLISNLSICTDSDLLSDHYPLLLTVKDSLVRSNRNTGHTAFKQWNTESDSVNWESFQSTLSAFLVNWNASFHEQLSTLEDLSTPPAASDTVSPHSTPSSSRFLHQFASNMCESVWSSLRNCMITAGDLCVGRRSRCSRHQLNGWWKYDSNDLRAALINMRYHHRRYVRHRSSADLRHAYINARSIFRALVDSAKLKWKEARSRRIHDSVNAHHMDWDGWRQVSRHSSIHPTSIPDSSNRLPVNQQQSVENIAQFYERIFHTHNIPSGCHDPSIPNSASHESVISAFVRQPAVCESTSSEDGEFTYEDVEHACLHVKVRTAMGPDDISPYFIRYGGESLFRALHTFFNFCWRFSVLPQDLRDSNVLPIYKKSGPVNSANSFRPISITSVVARLFERLILPRLLRLLRPNALNRFQAGFRSKHACYDHLFQLYHHVHRAFASKSYLPVAFLDIEKAYDSVWQDGLLYKLFNVGIKGAAWRFIRTFISDRRFRVSTNNTLSTWYSIHAGVPQGAVLSPLLFIIFINDIYSEVPCSELSVRLCLFADDIAVIPYRSAASPSPSSLSTSLALALSAIGEWATRWKIKFSPSKSAYVWFSRRQTDRPIHPDFKIGSVTLSEHVSYKYLGVIFERRGSAAEQFNHVISKTIAASYVVNRLIQRTYSPSPVLVNQLVNMIIRSTMSYGIIFWPIRSSMFAKLNSILIRSFRSFAQVPRSVHQASILCEYSALSAEQIYDVEMVRFVRRISKLESSHPSRVLFDRCLSSSSTDAGNGSAPCTNWSSFRGLARAVHAKYQRRFNRVNLDSHARIVNASLGPYINTATLPALHLVPDAVFQALLRFDRWFNLHRSNATGIKAYLPMDRPFVNVNVDLPAFFTYDYNRDTSIARFRSRLRLNRARTNYYLHRIDSTVSPACPFCGQLDTMQHILVECPHFQVERDFAEAAIFRSTGLLPLSLSLILGFVDGYSTDIQVILLRETHDYLKQIAAERDI
jgi:hypothetical protein